MAINAILVRTILKHIHPKKTSEVFLRLLHLQANYGLLMLLERLLNSVVQSDRGMRLPIFENRFGSLQLLWHVT